MSDRRGSFFVDWPYVRPWIQTVSPLDRTLWALVLAAATADTVLTIIGLELCFVEANPVAAAAIDMLGVFGLVALKGASLLVLFGVSRRLSYRYTLAALFGFSLPQLVATGMNSMLLLNHAASCL